MCILQLQKVAFKRVSKCKQICIICKSQSRNTSFLFYFILFYSYTDLAVEPCRTSRYMFVSPENLWRNKNWSLGETRENLVEYAVAKEICTCSYLLKQTVDLVELRKRVGGLG